MQEQAKCKGLITEKEVINVLKDMKNGNFQVQTVILQNFINFFGRTWVTLF